VTSNQNSLKASQSNFWLAFSMLVGSTARAKNWGDFWLGNATVCEEGRELGVTGGKGMGKLFLNIFARNR
tara:strand:- start:1394 stop:1603 length:210 start_codon:yes stop_codon:yes gene_type:complete